MRGSIFKVFSRRPRPSKSGDKPLTEAFRNRVLLLCRDTFGESSTNYGRGDYTQEFWLDIHKKLQYLHGRPRLSDAGVTTQVEDALLFLLHCSDDQFLDFVEFVFQVDCLRKLGLDQDRLVADVNLLFEADDLPYALTGFAREKGRRQVLFQDREVSQVIGFPQVIRRDDRVVHAMAIAPALTLLTDASFTSADREFREALVDYRKGDYGDCLVKCGSSFESVMKILCHRKGWAYQESDTASTLLRTILARTDLDTFFEQPLLLIATLRNRLSKGHGAGTGERIVPRHVAGFAINATASAILLLVSETSP